MSDKWREWLSEPLPAMEWKNTSGDRVIEQILENAGWPEKRPPKRYALIDDGRGTKIPLDPTLDTINGDIGFEDWCLNRGIGGKRLWTEMTVGQRYGYLKEAIRRGYVKPKSPTFDLWLKADREAHVRLSVMYTAMTVAHVIDQAEELFRLGHLTISELRRIYLDKEDGLSAGLGFNQTFLTNSASTISNSIVVGTNTWANGSTFSIDYPLVYSSPAPAQPAKPAKPKDLDPLAWLHAEVDKMVAYGTL